MESDVKYPIFKEGTVVYSKQPTDFHCYICPEKQKDSFEHHLKGENHVQRLECYIKAFANVGPRVYCRLCLKAMNFSEIIGHAVSHKLKPWYVPDECPEILFKNFISQRDHQYFCHLCNVKLPFWFMVEYHNRESHHQSLKREKIDESLLQDLSFSIDYYKIFTSNSIFMKTPKSLTCSLCPCDVGTSYDEIITHIVGISHQNKEKEHITALETAEMYRVPPEFSPKSQNSQNPLDKSDLESSDTSEDGDIQVICTVCHSLVDSEDIESHLLIHKGDKKKRRRNGKKSSDLNANVDNTRLNEGSRSVKDDRILEKIDKGVISRDEDYTTANDCKFKVSGADQIPEEKSNSMNCSLPSTSAELSELPEEIVNNDIPGLDLVEEHVEGVWHQHNAQQLSEEKSIPVNGTPECNSDSSTAASRTSSETSGRSKKIADVNKKILLSEGSPQVDALPVGIYQSASRASGTLEKNDLKMDPEETDKKSFQISKNIGLPSEPRESPWNSDNLPEGIERVISGKGSPVLFCTICNCCLPPVIPVDEHVASLDHRANGKKVVFRISEVAFVCEICNYTLQGYLRVLRQHLRGEDHLKNKAEKALGDSTERKKLYELPEEIVWKPDNGRFWCRICSSDVTGTLAHLNLHLKKHKTSVERLLRDKKISYERNALAESSKNECKLKSEECGPPSALNRKNRDYLPEGIEGVSTHSGKLFLICTICNCKLPRSTSVDQHVASHDHRANGKKVIVRISKHVFKCEICNCTLERYPPVMKHLRSQYHHENRALKVSGGLNK